MFIRQQTILEFRSSESESFIHKGMDCVDGGRSLLNRRKVDGDRTECCGIPPLIEYFFDINLSLTKRILQPLN